MSISRTPDLNPPFPPRMLGIMQDIVNAFSSNPLWRKLFWQLGYAAPWLLAGLLVLLFIADWRRTAVAALAFSTLCAVTMAVIFHVYYAIPTWGGHESAIRWLDRSAAWAGFTAGAVAVLVIASAHRAIRRRRG